jgi:methyl-accepting chemotaxis protein PixJ
MTQAPEKPKLSISSITKNDPSLEISSSPNVIPRKKNTFPIVKWFYNLSIRKKQLLVLLSAQAISIVALSAVGINEVIQGGRELLINQSKSELEAIKVNYGIKINQMGFGFRGQSDNVAIINAALAKFNGVSLTPEERDIVKQILQNEIKVQDIEYATLVGRNKRIIVNVNRDRTGEMFDPQGLVSEVINIPKQLKVSEIVSWEELKRESPPILSQLKKGQDALIRYTFTPVFDPDTQLLIGVFVLIF